MNLSDRDVMLQLLEKNKQTFNVLYKGFLANHLPHALIALHFLGAPTSRLQAFYESYSKQLEPKKPSQIKLDNSNWKEKLGKETYYSDYLEFFETELQKNGRKQTFARYLPELLEGISSSAFHGLIDIGFGLRGDNDSTVAIGLAHIACTYVSVGKIGDKPSDKDPLGIILELKSNPDFSFEKIFSGHKNKRFQKRVAQVIRCCGDALHQFDLRVDEETLPKLPEKLWQCLLILLANSGYREFFLLHGITSFYALEHLLKYLEKEVALPLIRHYWRALLCTYLAQGAIDIRIPDAPFECPIEWNEIIEKAISNDEEHLIKLVLICKEKEDVFGGLGIWKDVSAKALAIVSIFDWKF